MNIGRMFRTPVQDISHVHGSRSETVEGYPGSFKGVINEAYNRRHCAVHRVRPAGRGSAAATAGPGRSGRGSAATAEPNRSGRGSAATAGPSRPGQ